MTFAPQKEELAGTIDSVISRSIVKSVYNDGDRTFLTLQQECKTNMPVITDSQAIIVPLTNPNLDFVMFDKSYIHLNLTMRFKVDGYETPGREPPKDADDNEWSDKGLDVDEVAPEEGVGYGMTEAQPQGQPGQPGYNIGHLTDAAQDAFNRFAQARAEEDKQKTGGSKIWKIFMPWKWFSRTDDDKKKVQINLRRALMTFVGFKNSSDFLQEYAIFHKGKQVTGTLQSNATVESFLYHNFRAESDLAYKPYEHTVPHAAKTYDTSSVCGRFVSLHELQASMADAEIPALALGDEAIHRNTKGLGVIEVPFELNIPFNDILPFQQFRTYPAALFGDLEIRFRVNPRALVTLTCDPENCLRRFIEGNTISCLPSLTTIPKSYSLDGLPYTKDFTQLGDWFRTITHFRLRREQYNHNYFFQPTTAVVRWNFIGLNITECHTILTGYRANPAALESMRAKFMVNPWVKFSQNLNYLQFPSRPMKSGFNQVVQTYLNETTDFIILFPTTENEARGTVSKNPCLQDLSLTALNRKLPEMGLDTTSPEYLRQLLTSVDGKKPQREIIESILNPRWTDTMFKFSPIDRTSFVCAIKVERPSAMGLICDGLDSKGTQIPIRLQARPKYPETYDTYCGDPDNVVPPILITVNDCYWVFNAKNGGQCLYTSRPFNETVALFMAQ